MKIGELARRLGVSVATLRFYEQKGLVRPGRSEGGTRRYDEEDLARFGVIRDLVQLEVPLEFLAGLARVRGEHDSGEEASRCVEANLDLLEAELTAKQERLQAMLADIRLARQRLGGCHGCQRPPTRRECSGCAVADGLLETRTMRIVWDQKP
jgi:DNA-binding transcriptional MerR regulator